MSITVKQMQPRSRDAAHVKSPVVGIVPISKSQRHKRQGLQISADLASATNGKVSRYL